jgi:hypothetical protein
MMLKLENITENWYQIFIINKVNQNDVNKMHYRNETNDGSIHLFLDLCHGSNDVLLNKINYMINLLEEQQDERTNNVTEEVISLLLFRNIYHIFGRQFCASWKIYTINKILFYIFKYKIIINNIL